MMNYLTTWTAFQIFSEELFGTAAEEKDVQEIAAKTFEARTTKSYDAYQLVAQYVSQGCLVRLIAPVRAVSRLSTPVLLIYQHSRIFY